MAEASPPASPGRESPRKRLSGPEHYTVAWIAALPLELAVAEALRDEEHTTPENFKRNAHDMNNYAWGKIGNHNVTIASLPAGTYGNNAAATTAAQLRSSLPHIKFGLMVGIGAGIPKVVDGKVHGEYDVRLGDVVVSLPKGKSPGVVQHDLGKIKDGHFERVGALNKPPQVLLSGIASVQASHERHGSGIPGILTEMYTKYPGMEKPYGFQGTQHDVLVDFSEVNHDAKNVERQERESPHPIIHYGVIASGNLVVKDATTRSEIVSRLENECICVEMEAAGLMDTFPCLVIRGICDYADAGKNDRWEKYAAATAGAFAKELLRALNADDVGGMLPLQKSMNELSENFARLDDKFSSALNRDRINELVEWLKASDPSTNLRAAINKRHAETGSWLLRCKQFCEWETGSLPSIWIRGFPGSGKTILASVLLQHLRSEHVSSRRCLFFFFDVNDPAKQRLEDLIRSLYRQLLCHHEKATSDVLNRLYEKCARGTQQPSTERLVDSFHEALKRSPVDIVIDALDECTEYVAVLEHLHKLNIGKSLEVRMVITSRPLEEIKHGLSHISEEATVFAGDAETRADLNEYIHAAMEKDTRFRRWRKYEDLRKAIEEGVLSKANGMFRLASLQLQELAECFTPAAVKDRLERLPGTLFEMYRSMLVRVPKVHKREFEQLLRFLVFSQRRLAAGEIIDAIAVDPSKRPAFSQQGRMPDITTVANLCPGLFETNGNENYASIRFSHASVKDYLVSEPGDHGFSLSEETSKIEITRTCLAYLVAVADSASFKMHEDGKSWEVQRSHWEKINTEFRFRQYSHHHWKDLMVSPKIEAAIQKDILSMIECAGSHLVAKYSNPLYYGYGDPISLRNVDWMVEVCKKGLLGTVSRLISIDTDRRNNYQPPSWDRNAALVTAAYFRKVEIFQLLLENGVDPCFDNGALFRRLSPEDSEITRCLLKHPNVPQFNLDWTVEAALAQDNIDVIALLVHHHKGLNIPILLERACKSASSDIFQGLLSREATPNVGRFLYIDWNARLWLNEGALADVKRLEIVRSLFRRGRVGYSVDLREFFDYLLSRKNTLPTSSYFEVLRLILSSVDDEVRSIFLKFVKLRAVNSRRISRLFLTTSIRQLGDVIDFGKLLVECCTATDYRKVKILVGCGVDVNCNDAEPLRIACAAGDPHLAAGLLRRGADPCRTGSSSRIFQGRILSALDIAQENGKSEMVDLLEKYVHVEE